MYNALGFKRILVRIYHIGTIGEYIWVGALNEWQAGDIMSMDGHVWISVGMCEDGSKSEAVALAERVMSTYYPEWYAKYPDCSRPYSYLTSSSAMRWNRETLRDDEGLTEMKADEIIEMLY